MDIYAPMAQNNAQYILRYYLPVLPDCEESITELRFHELLEFCYKNKVTAVMFYVGLHTDWYYMPDTLEHMYKCVAQMMPYIEELKQKNISYQINFQNLFGAVTGGNDFREEYGWKTMVDHKGHESTGVACPLCKTFRSIMEEQLSIWAATKPDIIWLDDDFRLHNHGALMGSGKPGEGKYRDWFCYCDTHLKQFSEKIGLSLTRSQLLARILAPGKPDKIRSQWMEFLNETMAETAEWIHKTVHVISPDTRLAQMTSLPDVHSAEGRNWRDFLQALTGSRYPAVLRPHFGPYAEGDPTEFVNCFIYAEQLRANIAAQYGEAEYCPELENTRFTAWGKSVAATRFQLYLSLLMGCSNITLSLYDLEGSPFDEEPEYGALLCHEKKGLDELASLNLNRWESCGIILITHPENANRVHLKTQADSLDAIAGKNRTFDSIFARIGVPIRYMTPEDALQQSGLIVVDGYTVFAFSDEQLDCLMSKTCLLDGSAAEVLYEKKYGAQIGVEMIQNGSCVTSAEIFHMQHYQDGTEKRMPCRLLAECWKEINVSSNTSVESTLVTSSGKRVPGLIYTKNRQKGSVWIYPAVGETERGFFNHGRAHQLRQLVRNGAPDIPLIYGNRFGISIVKRQGQSLLMAVAPLSADGFLETTVYLGRCFDLKKVEVFENGCFHSFKQWEKLPDEEYIQIHKKLELYDWLILRIT